MNQQIERSLEIEKQSTFQQRIDAITGRQLRPEIIDSYADDALEDLISVVDDVTAAYEAHPVVYEETARQHERAAFAYYGLNAATIEETLDHIACIADEIHALDETISRITQQTNHVIIRSDSHINEIVPNDGSFEQKQTIPRLKTLLFVASKEFGINLNDEEQVRVHTGLVKAEMMRGESYRCVELPGLGRTIFVCDEQGNATYVFNNERLIANGIEPTELGELTKADLNDLISDEPTLGRKITYTNRYIEKLVSALSDQNLGMKVKTNNVGQYLQKAEVSPEGFVTRAGLAKQLDVDPFVIRRAVDELGESLGQITAYRFKHGAPTYGYSPAQQSMIIEHLTRGRKLERNDGLPVYGVAQKLGVSRSRIYEAIESLGDELGEVAVVRGSKKGMKIVERYSEDQQEMIRDFLEKNGWFIDLEKENGMTIGEIAAAYGTDSGRIQRTIARLEENLRQPYAKVGRRDFYSLEQQAYIYDALEKEGAFIDGAPAGYLTVAEMGRTWGGILQPSIMRAIEAIGDELGEPTLGKNPVGRMTAYYSPSQMAEIQSWLMVHGREQTRAKLAALAIGGR